MAPGADVPAILLVCTGNVCRSPYLERRLQAELDRSWGVAAVRVHSAGTDARPGVSMDAEAARRLGDAGGVAHLGRGRGQLDAG